jgi:hypothetical protein
LPIHPPSRRLSLSAALPLSLKAYKCASTQTREKHTIDGEQYDLQIVYKTLMNLGVFHTFKWSIGVVFIGPNPISSCWTESSSFLSTGAPYSPVRTGQGIVHCPVHATSVDRWIRPLVRLPGARRTVRCGLMTVGLANVADADCAADRWSGARLAHRTVRCTPDSLVIYSRSAPNCFPRAICSPRASLGTGQSRAPRLVQLLYSNLSSFETIPST